MDPSLHRAKRKAIQYVWYEQKRSGAAVKSCTNLCRRLNLCEAVPISLFWAPRTQRITGSVFGISFHFDWQTQLITFITCMVSSKLLYSLT